MQQQLEFFPKKIQEPSSQEESIIDAKAVESLEPVASIKDISNIKTEFKTFNFKKYISEFSEQIRELIQTKGIHLIRAAAGGGKTYSIATICKALSKINEDTVYIIACPNRIQNIQNRGYTIHSLVGEEDVPDSARVISMVYDKADTIIEQFINKGKKVVLIVDESHQLISAKSFRKRAIELLDNLADKCETVIHMTATSRKLSHIFKYSQVLSFESIDDISNIEDFEIIQTDDLHTSLINLIGQYKSKNIVPVVHLNDIEGLKAYEDLLIEKGHKVGLITSHHKNEPLFLTIADKGFIPNDFDVILTTSVLEVGTNLYNTNIVPIQAVNNINHFDTDATIQFFARPRILIDKAILLIPSVDPGENFSFKDINYIKYKIRSEVNKAMNFTKALYEKAIKMNIYSQDEINKIFNNMLKTEQSDDTTLGRGILKVDSDNNCLIIDERKLVQKAYNEYDKQLLINTDKLIETLKAGIKCRRMHITKVIESKNDDAKKLKEMLADNKDKASEKAREIILSLSDKYQVEFIEYLNNPDLLDEFFGGELKDNLLFLEQEHKELKKIVAANKAGLDFNIIIDLYKNDKCLKTNIRAFSYIERNNLFKELNYMKKMIGRDEYSIIRKHLDKCISRGNARKISDATIIEIANDMYAIGKMKSTYKKLLDADTQYKDIYDIYKHKSRSATNKAKLEKAKENRKKQFSKLQGKLLKEIELIYNISNTENTYKINSLKTSFKPI